MTETIPFIHLPHKLDYLRSKKRDLKIIATNGCFDILHIGHIRSLQKAKTMGDILIVGINSDESVKKLKGDSRPINNQAYRAEMLAALSCVDIVTIFNELTAEKFLEVVKPAVYVKGEEYDLDNLPEAKLVKALGGKTVKLQNVPGQSTTEFIKKLKNI